MRDVILAQLAQQIAEYVVLQRRTDGPGSVYRMRDTPFKQQDRGKKVIKSDFSIGLDVAFDNDMHVFVGVSLLSGAISQCCVFARPHVFEHGEWVLADTDPIGRSISGEELRQFREDLRAKVDKEVRDVAVTAAGR